MQALRRITRLVDATVAPYVVILALTLFLLRSAFQIPPGSEGRLGADVWPKTILLLAVATCAWEIARKLWINGTRKESSPSTLVSAVKVHDEGVADDDVPAWLPWLGIALTTLYVFVFSEVGYFLATLGFTALFVYFGNYRRPIAAVAVGFVATLGFMLIFMKIVYVALPLGIEPFARLSALIMGAMGIK